jgi:hypothetical protein
MDHRLVADAFDVETRTLRAEGTRADGDGGDPADICV